MRYQAALRSDLSRSREGGVIAARPPARKRLPVELICHRLFDRWNFSLRVASKKRALYASFASRIGASPSGKAADFDSAMRRFESSRPSHFLLQPSKRSGAAGLGPSRWLGFGRIIRPDMFGVAPFHLAFHRRPGPFPKARKIARDLDGAMGG